MTLEETQRVIEAELTAGRQARKAGNEGMVRVCVRRAAGAALGFWLETHPRQGWGMDAMTRLKGLAQAVDVSGEVRDAASRLTARVTPAFTSPHTTDPLEDARIIIRHLLGSDPS